MKKTVIQTLLGLLLVALARADTPLSIGVSSYGAMGPCWNTVVVPPTPMTASFVLPGVGSVGTFNSQAETVGIVATNSTQLLSSSFLYAYILDMHNMVPDASHCITLLIHFGTPLGCGHEVLVLSGSPGAQVTSASKAPHGDITFTFGGACFSPPQTAALFSLISDAPPVTRTVTIIDDYINPITSQPAEQRVNVTALVPDIPPNWAYAPAPPTFPFMQGSLSTNSTPGPNAPVPNGSYDFTLQLFNAASNGLPVGPMATQSVQVANGLFNMPLPFDPSSMGDGSARWLSLGVKPTGDPGAFNSIMPLLPVTPTPQALYAFAAGVVADLSPGQAVTGLNGLTDAVSLQAGPGIVLGTNGNTLTITAQPGVASDRNLKMDFTPVNTADVLARLATLPMQSWRYTNESPGVRHLGPMAQDFRQTFGLGPDDRFIAFVDGQGVALAAIQALNRRMDELQEKLAGKEAENAELKQRLATLEKAMLSQKSN